MARIREDLDGVVTAGSVTLKAGDVIPDGVHVGGHLTDTGVAVNVPAAPVQAVAQEADVDALNEDDTASAETLGIPTDGVHPERVRGALVGYAQGWDDAVAELAKEQTDDEQIEGQGTLETFNPADHNAVEVHEYIAAHPDEKDAVLALEAAGKNRSSLLAKY